MLNKAGHLYFFMSHFEISRLFVICIFLNLIYVVLNKVLKKGRPIECILQCRYVFKMTTLVSLQLYI